MADLEHFAEEFCISEEILVDYILEVYVPAKDDDCGCLQAEIQMMIKAHAEGQDVIEPE